MVAVKGESRVQKTHIMVRVNTSWYDKRINLRRRFSFISVF